MLNFSKPKSVYTFRTSASVQHSFLRVQSHSHLKTSYAISQHYQSSISSIVKSSESIFFFQYNRESRDWPTRTSIRDKIQEAFPGVSPRFVPDWFFVATWHRVTFYGVEADPPPVSNSHMHNNSRNHEKCFTHKCGIYWNKGHI